MPADDDATKWKKRFRFVVAFLFFWFVLSAIHLFQLPLANDPQDELSRYEVRRKS